MLGQPTTRSAVHAHQLAKGSANSCPPPIDPQETSMASKYRGENGPPCEMGIEVFEHELHGSLGGFRRKAGDMRGEDCVWANEQVRRRTRLFIEDIESRPSNSTRRQSGD